MTFVLRIWIRNYDVESNFLYFSIIITLNFRICNTSTIYLFSFVCFSQSTLPIDNISANVHHITSIVICRIIGTHLYPIEYTAAELHWITRHLFKPFNNGINCLFFHSLYALLFNKQACNLKRTGYLWSLIIHSHRIGGNHWIRSFNCRLSFSVRFDFRIN